jgi:hypothetical protein
MIRDDATQGKSFIVDSGLLLARSIEEVWLAWSLYESRPE